MEPQPSNVGPEFSSIEPQISIIESYAITPQAAVPRRRVGLFGGGVALAATVLAGVSAWWVVNSDSPQLPPAGLGKASVSTASPNREIAAVPPPAIAEDVVRDTGHGRNETSQVIVAAAPQTKITALPRPAEAPRAVATMPATTSDTTASIGIPAKPASELKQAAAAPPSTVAAKPAGALPTKADTATVPKIATAPAPIKLQIAPQSLSIATTVPPLLQASPDVVRAPTPKVTAEPATKPTDRALVSTAASASPPEQAPDEAHTAATPKTAIKDVTPEPIKLETVPQSVTIATTVPPLLRATPTSTAAPMPKVAMAPVAKEIGVQSSVVTEPAPPPAPKLALTQSPKTVIDANKAEPLPTPAQSKAITVSKAATASIAPKAIKLEAVPQSLFIAGTVPPLLRVTPDPVAESALQIAAAPMASSSPILPLANTALRIVIHYASPDAGARAVKSREALIAKGIAEVELRKVSKPIPRDELRYFHSSDQQNAVSLSSAGAGLERFEAYSLAGKGFRAPPGLVEVWLRGSDNVAPPKKKKVAVPKAKPLPRQAATYSSQPTVEPIVEELQIIRRIPRNERRGRYFGRPAGAPLTPSPREGWGTCDC